MSVSRSHTRLPAFATCLGEPAGEPRCAWIEFEEDGTPAALIALKRLASDHADSTGHEAVLYLATRLHFLPSRATEGRAA